MTDWFTDLPCIKKVVQERIRLDRPFEQAAAAFAEDEGTVVLLSGSDLDCSQYHILAVKPWLALKSRQDAISLTCLEKELHLKAEPFAVVRSLVTCFSLEDYTTDLPVSSGLFGYFAYDLKDRIERLPITCMDTGLPDLCLYAPSIVLVQDKKTGHTDLCIPMLTRDGSAENPEDRIQALKAFFFDRLDRPVDPGSFSVDSQGFKTSVTKPEYLESVRKITAYLKAGDIYQANLSQRFETGFSGDAYALFLDLFERNPASFFSFVNAGDHKIVSTSPERFLKQTGRKVETRPIKGTIARGRTREEDMRNGRDLTESLKDDAELTMIVDLMRNDLSRVTRHGSVIVTEHKRLEPYDNVFHLVSIVEGELEKGKTSVDLLEATFPGGSITGCPKIRSMEIIDELEPVKRHVYTGSIGYLSFHDTMDLSIAIRTATIAKDVLFFSVGGGIVFDSDAEKEYQETLDKGRTLMESLSGKKQKNQTNRIKAWVDGKIIDQADAQISALSTGVQYGAGLFETIRVEKGIVFRLADHVARLNGSWEALFDGPPPDVTWEDVIGQVIRANGFETKSLAIKIMAARDEQSNGKNAFLAVFAREYVHRLDMLGKKGVDLVTYPHTRHSLLADHKSLNYFYYERAGRFARARQADEALILNPDLTVSETNTANILMIKDRCVIVPESGHVLAGISQKSVLTLLSEKGYDIQKRKIDREAIVSFPNIILTNALMGAVKVLSIDGESVRHDDGICSMINRALFKID